MREQTTIVLQLSVISIIVVILTASCSYQDLPVVDIPGSATGLSVLPSQALASSTPRPLPSQTSTPGETEQPVEATSITGTSTPVPSSTPTVTPLPSLTATPSLTPTGTILRGTVLEQANCRYGPGAAYLYKYGLYPGNNLEIIGRNEKGSWIMIRAIGGTNPCWVKASLLDIKGDVMSLALAFLPLPQSPYYAPLTGVSAQRTGETVVISWHPLILRAGDDSLQYPYLAEVWLCNDGELEFTPIGSWETFVSVKDQPGCSEPSHGRVYGVEKHGYTSWVDIPWPQP